MKISVIIPTYNGVHKILSILHSLERQDQMPHEVIVVIDGSTDGTAELLRGANLILPEVRIIEQPNTGRAKVRNSGAKHATGELLIFFDDDLILDSHCIKEHLSHHLKFPNSILTGGLRHPDEQDPTELSRFKEYLGKRWSKGLIENHDLPLNESNYFVMAANLSLKKDLFFKLKGFDVQLNDAEDFDFGTRALKENIPMFFNNHASGIHNENPTTPQYVKRLNQYREAREQLVQAKPELYLNFKKINVIPPKGLKKLFFTFFRSKEWVDSIDNKTWVWMPEKVRFKLYDYIITANTIFK